MRSAAINELHRPRQLMNVWAFVTWISPLVLIFHVDGSFRTMSKVISRRCCRWQSHRSQPSALDDRGQDGTESADVTLSLATKIRCRSYSITPGAGIIVVY